MRVFISWSKEPSRTVAEALRDWLPDVIQSLKPWMSSTDIGAGARWSERVAEALAETKIGILCVTPNNQHEPWLLFEAGAIAKTLDDTFVCPYLIQMRPADLSQGPLTQFQAKLANREGTFELLSMVTPRWAQKPYLRNGSDACSIAAGLILMRSSRLYPHRLLVFSVVRSTC